MYASISVPWRVHKRGRQNLKPGLNSRRRVDGTLYRSYLVSVQIWPRCAHTCSSRAPSSRPRRHASSSPPSKPPSPSPPSCVRTPAASFAHSCMFSCGTLSNALSTHTTPVTQAPTAHVLFASDVRDPSSSCRIDFGNRISVFSPPVFATHYPDPWRSYFIVVP